MSNPRQLRLFCHNQSRGADMPFITGTHSDAMSLCVGKVYEMLKAKHRTRICACK
jgi:hypothetical protein